MSRSIHMFNRHKVALYEQDAFDQRSGSREEMMRSAGGKKRLEVKGPGWELNLTLPKGVSCWKYGEALMVSVSKPNTTSKVTKILAHVVAYLRQPKVAIPKNKKQWLDLVEKKVSCSLDGLGGVTFTYYGREKITGVLRETSSVSAIDFKAKLPCLSVKNIKDCDKKSVVVVEFKMTPYTHSSSSRFDLGKAAIEGLINKTVDGWMYVISMLKQMAPTWDQWKANASKRLSFWKAVKLYINKDVEGATSEKIRALADEYLTVTVGSAAGADGVGVGASDCKGSKVGNPVTVAEGVTPFVTIMTGVSAEARPGISGKRADAVRDASGIGMADAVHRIENDVSTAVFTEGGAGAASNTNSAAGAGVEPVATGMAENTEVDADGRVTKMPRVDKRSSKCGVPVSVQAQSESDFADDLSLEGMASYGVGLGNCANAVNGLESLLLGNEDTLYREVDIDNLFNGLDGVTPTPTSTPLLTAAAPLDPDPGKGLGAPQVKGGLEP